MSDPAPFGFNTPFYEQIEFFRKKLNLPSERWDDIRKAAHDRAFIVAGVMKADLLGDLRQAVDKAITTGTTIETFRKDFRALVAKHGWTGWTGEGSPGGFAWRTRVIYETNLRTSHAAGRWAQLTSPDLLKHRPFWRYVHADSVMHPRPHHQRWGNMRLTLRHDHPFWKTHFPPNGWGCRCRVTAVTGPHDGDATVPPEGWNEQDSKGLLPGIDQGWDYAPGANAARPLKDFIDAKLIALDAPIGAAMYDTMRPVLAMERELAWWETLDAWRADPVPRGRYSVLGALGANPITWLQQKRQVIPISGEIAVQDRLVLGPKEARHQSILQNGLTDAEWRRLPKLLEAPDRILYQESNGHLLFVIGIADDAAQKLTVEFDYRVSKSPNMKINMIVSAFRQSEVDIDGAIRGGLLTPVE